MKWKALIVLLVIAVGVIAPPALPVLVAQGCHPAIGTMDFCHHAAPALSGNGDMPCLHVSACCPLPLVAVNNPKPVPSPFKPLLIAFQDERPPRV